MRCYNNDWVLFFIKKDRLDRTRHLAYLTAVFKVVGETNTSWLAAEEEKAIDVVASGRSGLVEDQTAENNLADAAFARILADGG